MTQTAVKLSMFCAWNLLGAASLSFVPQPYMMLGDAVVPNDTQYIKAENIHNNTQTIFTQPHTQAAYHAIALDEYIISDYEKLYGWKFDEKLFVGLLSNHNQIANGFSTQWPNNRQMNYVGGAQASDYFSSIAWLDTLLYHETAHNYQINIKDNVVSQTLHTLFGNTILFPLWTLPNLAINPLMLEGNAVLNESWHGNGGRLYSGRFEAETILQAQAGNLTPAKLYNKRLAFPYGDIPYVQGGFYNYYLAKTYGLKEANSFFRYNSQDWFWPFMTNNNMHHAVGVDFEQSIAAFAKEYKQKARHFIKAQGEQIAVSQFFNPLTRNRSDIYFLINETGVQTPEVVTLNKATHKVTKEQGSWFSGKVFYRDQTYYTRASAHTSPTQITQALYDKEGGVVAKSGSKVPQTFLSDGRMVYFDTNSSFIQPHLYIENEYFGVVNSSVISDEEDNIYYFKQHAKQRTLYKNKTPLYKYDGFYGVVCDVDTNGSVFFIANSQYGSTLYKYTQSGQVVRVLAADNIVDAKLIDDTHVLVAAIGTSCYYYSIVSLQTLQQSPYEVKLFFEDKPYYTHYNKAMSLSEKLPTQPYTPLFDMHYHGSNFYVGTANDTTVGMLNVLFADPLAQNSVNIFYQRDDLSVGIIGMGYANTQYLLHYNVLVYTTLEDGGYDTNDIGTIATLTLPLYQKKYTLATLQLNYYEDYIASQRNPLSLRGEYGVHKQYGISRFANYEHHGSLYGVRERDYAIYGGDYTFMHDLVDESYVRIEAKYSHATNTDITNQKGVKFSSGLSFGDMYDPSVISMPSYSAIAYLQDAGYGGIGLYKTFNFSKYYFTFPLSLQRESLYTKYRYYDLQTASSKHYSANETTVGIIFDTVVLNDMVVPIELRYMHNDASFIQDRDKFDIFFGIDF